MIFERIAVVGLLALAACGGGKASSFGSISSLPPTGPIEAGAAPATSAENLAAQKKERVRLQVTKAQGGLDSESSAAIEAARPHLEHCHPGSGGKIAVQVTKQARATYMSVVPGESLDPTEGHCVLEALSTVDLPETGGNVGGPAVKPSGFTSLITISW
jgi:hypothetical protein